MSRKRRALQPDAVIEIEALDGDGAGVGASDGWEVHAAGALPGERATVRVHRRRGRRLQASALTVGRPSGERVRPDCPWTARCGGCALQHLEPARQRERKMAALASHLEDAGAGRPECWLAPVAGPLWGYRSKARLGVRHVPGKGGVLLGFRERGSARVADVESCRVLVPAVGERIGRLRGALNLLRARASIPQLEIAAGDREAAVIVRHLEPLGSGDLDTLTDACARLGLQLWLQPGGPETVYRVLPAAGPERLHYALGVFGLELAFHPLDFTQVNPLVNRRLVAQALRLLDPRSGDHVLDLFCGLGNFTLPLAKRSASVTGVEASAELVARARENACRNGVDNARFECVDLDSDDFDPAALPRCQRLLLDPPRSGAERVARWLAAAEQRPRRIVYVACSPTTLARDAALLGDGGYRLAAAGIVDMFPHTAHVESIAVFEANAGGEASW